MRFEKTDEGGTELFEKYNARSTPTLLVLETDGTEIDRTVSFYPRDERFLKKIEKIYNREDLFSDLKKKYETNPDNLENTFKLAFRYQNTFYWPDKANELYKQIISKPEEARQIISHHEYTDKNASIYEQSLYQLGEVKYLDRLLMEIPESKIREGVVARKASVLAFPQSGTEYSNISEFYQEAIEEFPENKSIRLYYIYYGTFQKKDIPNVIKVADEWYKNGGNKDMVLMSNYARLLEMNNDTIKLMQVYGPSYLENMPDDTESALTSYIAFWNRKKGNEEGLSQAVQMYENQVEEPQGKQFIADYYLKKGNEEKALELFGEKYVETIKEDDAMLNSYAWWWVQKEKNLESALSASQLSVQIEKTKYNVHTLAFVHWKMGNLTEAVKCFEEALEIDPDYATAKKDLKKVKEEMVTASTT